MAQPAIQGNFSKGELAPSLWGMTQLAAYHNAAATARNMFVNYRGGLSSRAGTALVGRTKQQYPNPPPRDISFQFSLSQAYVLEFGEKYMRIKSGGAYVLEPSFSMQSATQANPCQIGASGHDFINGDWVFFSGIGGMTQLNGNTYIVASAVAGVSFVLHDLDGNPVDATGYGAYTTGGTVARLYTLAAPYAAADLPYLKFAQSADVMSLTLVNVPAAVEYPPYELSRLGTTNWTLAPLNPGAQIASPQNVAVTASNNPNPGLSPPTQPCAYAYEVTAVAVVSGQESNPSARADVTNSVDMGVTAGSITVTWGAVPGVSFYNIYRTNPNYNTKTGDTAHALPAPAGSFFFYAGQAYGNSFVDTNVVTNANKTPPLHLDPFSPGQVPSVTMISSSSNWTHATVALPSSTGTGWTGEVVIVNGSIVAVIVDNAGKGYTPADANSLVFTGDGTSASGTANIGPQSGTYPAVASYFQQRRIYAQTLNRPDTYWTSQSGNFTDYDSGNPPIDTDAITGSPFSQIVDGIQWLVPMPGGLVILTGDSAWQLGGAGGSALNPQPITPSSEQAQSQAFNGVHDHVGPIRINYDILYVERHGSFVYDLNYNIYFNIYFTTDISWPSAHLFQNHQIQQWAWQQQPYKLIWAAREDGILTSLTFVKEQEVAGWTRHDTQGLVVGVCTITEPAARNVAYLTAVDALYLIVQRYVQNRWLYFAERMDDRLWQSGEDAWCVDCGLSTLTQASFPLATLTPSAASGGGVTFEASAAVFSAANVGNVLRLGGGIAAITQYTSPNVVIGNWGRPMTQTIPGDPNNTPIPAQSLLWSMLPQVASVAGLGHLSGKQVVGVADGIPIGPLTVAADGSVALPFIASLVTLGLSFTPQFQSLPIDADQPTQQGRRKNLYAVSARLAASAYPLASTDQQDGSAQDPAQIAPVWNNLVQTKPSPAGTAPATYQTASGQKVQPLYTGDVRASLYSQWAKPGQIAIQQNVPLPLDLVAIMPEYLDGDLPDTMVPPRQPPRGQQPPTQRAA